MGRRKSPKTDELQPCLERAWLPSNSSDRKAQLHSDSGPLGPSFNRSLEPTGWPSDPYSTCHQTVSPSVTIFSDRLRKQRKLRVQGEHSTFNNTRASSERAVHAQRKATSNVGSSDESTPFPTFHRHTRQKHVIKACYMSTHFTLKKVRVHFPTAHDDSQWRWTMLESRRTTELRIRLDLLNAALR